MPEYDRYLADKYKAIEENEQLWQTLETEDAEYVLVAYGISSRICKETVAIARRQGIRLGLIRPITLYPFPVKAFENCPAAKAFVTVELTALAQMAQDVATADNMRRPVYSVTGGMTVFEPAEILDKIQQIASGNAKEVYKAK